jgi:hypothetical protein
VNINNDDLLLEFFSKTFTRKDHNNTGGGFLIYFKDHISVERVTGLQNDDDDLGEHAHYLNPSKFYFSFHFSGEYSLSIRY